jgi:superoxide oxidase
MNPGRARPPTTALEKTLETPWKNTASGYGWPAICFHWLMLLVIAAAYATMELKGIFPRGSAGRESMASLHYLLGLAVFLLAWLRLPVNLAGADPVIAPALPHWQAKLARITHGMLYVLMIALPLLGWLTVNAKGTPVTFLGAQLPALIGESREAAKWLKEIHEAGANAGYFLIGLHAAAALYHHYVARDNTLRLMLRLR